MEKEIINRVEARDDLMIWRLEKEGIKLENEKIAKQEEQITELKIRAAEIGRQIERQKGPKIIFGNVCSILGETNQTRIRKQVIRDFIAREQQDIMGMIETNIQEDKYEMKGIGEYVIYQTKSDKNKGGIGSGKKGNTPNN